MSAVQPFPDSWWSNLLKYLVSTAYLIAPGAYWAYNVYRGQPSDMLVWVLVLMLIIASAYFVYGKQTVEDALDTSQELTGTGGSDDDESEA